LNVKIIGLSLRCNWA